MISISSMPRQERYRLVDSWRSSTLGQLKLVEQYYALIQMRDIYGSCTIEPRCLQTLVAFNQTMPCVKREKNQIYVLIFFFFLSGLTLARVAGVQHSGNPSINTT